MWDRIRNNEFDVILSEVTLKEIYAITNPEKRKKLTNYLNEITSIELNVNDEIRRIADLIKTAGILTANEETNDRLHIGCALYAGADVLI